MLDAGSVSDINMGSDHKAVLLSVRIQDNTWMKRSGRPRRHIQWKNVDHKAYASNLAHKVNSATWDGDLDDKSCKLEGLFVEAAAESCDCAVAGDESFPEIREEIRGLIQRRKHIEHGSSEERAEVSKLINKRIRSLRRMECTSRIDKILAEFSGTKRIPMLKTSVKKPMMTCVLDGDTEITTRKDIANVFATFHEQLYSPRCRVDPLPGMAGATQGNVASFTRAEIQRGIKQLKKNKCADGAGVVAEMISSAGDVILDVLADLYNNLLKPAAKPPKSWRKAVIKVIHKAGDERLPKNYRPITIIPLLYKLFARLLHNRLQPILEPQQSDDQAGFRTGFSTEDHLFIVAMVQEKADEYRFPLWFAALDFQKAFDSVEHQALWNSLFRQGVPLQYIQILENLYAEQTAQVATDKESRWLRIDRGPNKDILLPF